MLAGGKGINVSRIVHTLGGRTCALCLLGGRTGRAIGAALLAESIPAKVVRLAGESRSCITIIDPEAHTQTEVNEPGPQVSPQELLRLLRAVRQSMRDMRPTWLALCGRMPVGIGDNFVGRIADECRKAGVWCAVDTSGPALAEAVDRHVDLVKPNEAELGAPDGSTDIHGRICGRCRAGAGVAIRRARCGDSWSPGRSLHGWVWRLVCAAAADLICQRAGLGRRLSGRLL